MKKINITFTEDKRDYLVTNIITDAIIFEKVSSGMNQLQKAFNPTAQPWEPEDNYSSVYNAFPLLGFHSPETISKEERVNPVTNYLNRVFIQAIKEESQKPEEVQRNAGELAKDILSQWKEFLTLREASTF